MSGGWSGRPRPKSGTGAWNSQSSNQGPYVRTMVQPVATAAALFAKPQQELFEVVKQECFDRDDFNWARELLGMDQEGWLAALEMFLHDLDAQRVIREARVRSGGSQSDLDRWMANYLHIRGVVLRRMENIRFRLAQDWAAQRPVCRCGWSPDGESRIEGLRAYSAHLEAHLALRRCRHGTNEDPNNRRGAQVVKMLALDDDEADVLTQALHSYRGQRVSALTIDSPRTREHGERWRVEAEIAGRVMERIR